MASSTHFCVAIAFMAIITLMPVASAFNLWKVQGATSLQVNAPNKYHSGPKITVTLPQRLEEAKHIIKTFDSMPPCPKIATAALMHSCASPADSAPSDTDFVSHKSDALKAYGARLAICELMEAHEASIIPVDCHAFVPTQHTTKKQTMAGYVGDDGYSEPTILYPGYDELTMESLDRCVKGLAQEPQSWSSYSNSKQNAVVICHSVQAELQMEQSVKTYEKIVNSFGGIVEHHEQMAQAYEAQLSEVRAAAKDLVSILHDQWATVYGTMKSDVSGFITTLHQQLFDILADASDATLSSLQKVKHTTSDLDNDITAIVERAKHASTQIGFAGQYVEHQFLQQLTRVFHELELQDGLVQSNNRAFNQLSIGLINTAVQVNRTNDELATTDAFAQNIRSQLEKANQDVEKFNQNVGYLANLVNFGWTGVIGRASLFFASTIVITPLTFGFWERWIGLSFLGNCGAALSTGLAFGIASAHYFDPTKFLNEYPTDVFEDEFTAHKHVIAGLLVGIIGTIGVRVISSAIRHYLAKTGDENASDSVEDDVEVKKEKNGAV